MRKAPDKTRKAEQRLEELTNECDKQYNGDMSKMSRTKQNSYKKHKQIIIDYYESLDLTADYKSERQKAELEFWRIEYLKRKFYLEVWQNDHQDDDLDQLFAAIAEWKNRRNKRLHLRKEKDECKRIRCHYSFKSKSGRQSLKFPFFYSDSSCQCEFSTIMKLATICLHNHRHPHFDTFINDLRLAGANDDMSTWSAEFTSIIELFQIYSYRYGFFAHDVFSLSSPLKILKSKGKIQNINHTEGFLLKDDEENIPDFMQIMRSDPKTGDFIPELSQRLKNFKLHIGIEIKPPYLSPKKQALLIRDKILSFKNNDNANAETYSLTSDSIIFSYNPFAKSFSLKKAMDTSREAIASYMACVGAWGLLGEEYQYQMSKKCEKVTHVKSYRSQNIQRALGLHIWDQVNYFGIPHTKAIRAIVNTQLYEGIRELDDDAKEERESIFGSNLEFEKDDVRVEDYNYAAKQYRRTYASIEAGKVLMKANILK